MAWTTITVENVRTRLAGAEVEALQTSALADGQTDPLPEIVGQVIDEIRGYVSAAGVTLGVHNTIPSKLMGAALAIIRYRLCSRLPVSSFMTDARIKENEEAQALLVRVSNGKFLVEEPTETDSEQSSAPSPSITRKTLKYTRKDQDGI